MAPSDSSELPRDLRLTEKSCCESQGQRALVTGAEGNRLVLRYSKINLLWHQWAAVVALGRLGTWIPGAQWVQTKPGDTLWSLSQKQASLGDVAWAGE